MRLRGRLDLCVSYALIGAIVAGLLLWQAPSVVRLCLALFFTSSLALIGRAAPPVAWSNLWFLLPACASCVGYLDRLGDVFGFVCCLLVWWVVLLIPVTAARLAARERARARQGSLLAWSDLAFVCVAGLLPLDVLLISVATFVNEGHPGAAKALVVFVFGSKAFFLVAQLLVARASRKAEVLVARLPILPEVARQTATTRFIDFGIGDERRGEIDARADGYREAPSASVVVLGAAAPAVAHVRANLVRYVQILAILYALPALACLAGVVFALLGRG